MSTKSEDEYIGTPLLEGATSVLLIGGNEIGREILVEAHRLGLESILFTDHQRSPASHLTHRQYVSSFHDDQALRAILKRERPEIVIQDSPRIDAKKLHEATEDLDSIIFPQPELVDRLQDHRGYMELARQAKVNFVLSEVASTLEELQEAGSHIGFPCIIQDEKLGTPARFMRSSADFAHVIQGSNDSSSSPTLLVKKFLSYDLQVTVHAVMTNSGSRGESICLTPPVGTLGSSHHAAWHPIWVVDDQTRMSSTPFAGYGSPLHRREEGTGGEYLWESELNGRYIPSEITRDVDSKLKDNSSKVIKKLQETLERPLRGLVRLEYLVRLRAKESGNKPEVYLDNISAFPNETSFLSLATQSPTIPSSIVRSTIGIPVRTVESIANGATHMIQARQKSGWAPAFFNLSKACGDPGTSLHLFAKHKFSASEAVGVAFALDQDILKAREKAMMCAHIVEEGIDYGS